MIKDEKTGYFVKILNWIWKIGFFIACFFCISKSLYMLLSIVIMSTGQSFFEEILQNSLQEMCYIFVGCVMLFYVYAQYLKAIFILKIMKKNNQID